jgi:tRNA-specific 2-thiouridylase
MKIALGLSGGVDSAVCAHLLVEQGHAVSTVFLECWNEPGCRTDQDRKDALSIALSLKLPFQVLDFKQAYREKVLQYFLDEYKAGRTPNPDVVCNREIKFGLFYEWAMAQGFDAIATGHYAKIASINGQKQLVIPKDTHKDQTYFLSQIHQKQLDHVVFPLANHTKNEVRTLATQKNILVANKKDSVGICFIGDINVHSFLKERLGENPGDIVDSAGNVVGSHKGLWFYTIGQRHGFTINQTSLVKNQLGEMVTKHNIPPFYVIGKNSEKNQLVVGFGEEAKLNQFFLADMRSIDPNLDLLTIENPLIRIRHGGKLLRCKLEKVDEKWQVTLDSAIQGISEGQFGVLYQELQDNIFCLGGGIIGLSTNTTD